MKNPLIKSIMLVFVLLFLNACPIKAIDDLAGKWKHQSKLDTYYYLVIDLDNNFEIVRFVNGVNDQPIKGMVELADKKSLKFIIGSSADDADASTEDNAEDVNEETNGEQSEVEGNKRGDDQAVSSEDDLENVDAGASEGSDVPEAETESDGIVYEAYFVGDFLTFKLEDKNMRFVRYEGELK